MGISLLCILVATPVSEGRAKKRSVSHRVKKTAHTQAYRQSNNHAGGYVNVKITPPEQRGRKGHVLVEVYNYTGMNLALVEFDLVLYTRENLMVTSHITVDGMRKNYGTLKYMSIPNGGRLPPIAGARIKRLYVYTPEGKRLWAKHNSNLIKR